MNPKHLVSSGESRSVDEDELWLHPCTSSRGQPHSFTLVVSHHQLSNASSNTAIKTGRCLYFFLLHLVHPVTDPESRGNKKKERHISATHLKVIINTVPPERESSPAVAAHLGFTELFYLFSIY